MIQENLSIKEKIVLAHKLLGPIRRHIEDQGRSHLLDDLRKEALRSRRLMDELGVSMTCAQCAKRNNGSGCCSKEIEEWYDEKVILLNLLLGVPVPDEYVDPRTCIFLGPRGCRLLVRYHFCVNYLCKTIEERLSGSQLGRLRAQYGRELYIAWRLEEEIWRYFNTNSCKGPTLQAPLLP